jgi:hypothetical protein
MIDDNPGPANTPSDLSAGFLAMALGAGYGRRS